MGENNTMIKESLISGNYLEAINKAKNMKLEDLSGSLLELAFENEEIVAYTFVTFLIFQLGENSDLHCLASSLLSHPLCHIDGAYKSALFHSRRALELSPNNISLKENLLFFHTIPDRLISKDEAILLAKDVLQTDSNSAIAKEVLEIYGY
ncbi:putative uncharacterized protein [Brevibacillus laterosporus GI-9]|nr:putative uncharacterized protein [Brevibacillus laterosporus GI-9]